MISTAAPLISPVRPWSTLRFQVQSELVKARSARSLWFLPLLAVIIGPASALLVGISDSLESNDTVLGGALTALTLPVAVIGAWGALIMTTEYSSGTIRPVLSATPQRDTVFAAKVITTAAISTIAGLLSTTLAYLVGLATIDASKYAAGQPFPGLLGIYLVFPAVALFGLAIGLMLRSSAGAVAAVSAHVVLPEAASATAFGELHKLMTLVAPTAVVGKLSQSADAADHLIGSLGGWPRLALVILLTLGVLFGGRRALIRKDV
ncbi:ABC transporter permease [Nocardia sp. XZ_19_385]|uniref:ABC transporter permease n=1 Tax=Nocardia sp. XZ_19_385 TaxID=2769488 RepID=UPI00188F235B|nr:ABC transporter permease [Nocardia sp. XZ_19_385]